MQEMPARLCRAAENSVCVCVCVSVCLSVRLSCSRSAGILVVEAEDTVLGIGPCSAKGADDGRHVVAGGFHLGDNVRRAACGVDELVGVCHETGRASRETEKGSQRENERGGGGQNV